MTRDFTVLGFMGESNSGKDFCSNWVEKNQSFVRVSFADPLKRFCKWVFEFTWDQLWGDSKYRNQPVIPRNTGVGPARVGAGEKFPKEWDHVYELVQKYKSEFTASLYLTAVQKMAYLKVLDKWYEECRERANDGLISARLVLQLLGTEYGRRFKDSMWVDTLYKIVCPMVRDVNRIYYPEQGIIHSRGYSTPPNGIIIPDHRFRNEMKLSQEYGGYVINLIRLSQQGKENNAEKWGIQGHLSEAEQRTIPRDEYDLVLELEDGAENVYPRLQKMFEEREWELRRKERMSVTDKVSPSDETKFSVRDQEKQDTTNTSESLE